MWQEPATPEDTAAVNKSIKEWHEKHFGPTGIEQEVCEDISRRQALGIKKYGVTVANNPLSLREWLEHAYQECLDQAVYLKRAIKELPPE